MTKSDAFGDRKPTVSVIVNCFNGEQYLHEAIDSVISQTCEEWELIFWDNQSTDSSAEIFRSYSDPRLKYFYAPKHTVLYEARNYAMEKASGEFFAFLDVDDWWLPEKLALQAQLFDDPEVGIGAGNYIVVSERQNRKWVGLTKAIPTGWVLNDLLDSYFVALLTLVVRRSAFESLSYPCDPRYHVSGDFDLVVRLSLHWKLAAVQQPIACYRLHGNNETDKHRALAVAERKLWCSEAAENAEIRNTPGFHRFVSEVHYREAMNDLMRGNRRNAFRIFRKIPRGRKKLKLALALVLPRRIWTLRHDRPVGSEVSDLATNSSE